MVLAEQAFGHHRFGAPDYFLGGLEHEEVAAAHVVDVVDERTRDADHHRHVRVVTARVHAPVGPRCERHAGFFEYRQAVDVRAQHPRLTRPARVQHGDDPGLGRARFELQPELAQSRSELPAGLVLAEAHFGVPMEVTSELDHLVDDGAARRRDRGVVVSHEQTPGCTPERLHAPASAQARARAYRDAASVSAAPNAPSNARRWCETGRPRSSLGPWRTWSPGRETARPQSAAA